jgi:hypothetical protein
MATEAVLCRMEPPGAPAAPVTVKHTGTGPGIPPARRGSRTVRVPDGRTLRALRRLPPPPRLGRARDSVCYWHGPAGGCRRPRRSRRRRHHVPRRAGPQWGPATGTQPVPVSDPGPVPGDCQCLPGEIQGRAAVIRRGSAGRDSDSEPRVSYSARPRHWHAITGPAEPASEPERPPSTGQAGPGCRVTRPSLVGQSDGHGCPGAAAAVDSDSVTRPG